MNRSAALFSIFILSACSGGEDLGDQTTPRDGGPNRPPVVRPDAGTTEAEVPLPTVTNVSPATGPETGGTRVTIRGTSFVEPAEVYFGALAASSVVVLDEVSIAATTPPNAVGPVTVRVVTPGGEGTLDNGFTYHRELVLESIEPARIPDEGGVRVILRGRGFDAQTIVLVDREPLRGQVLVDERRIEGYAPAVEPGRPEVRVIHADASVRRSDLLYVFGTPDLDAVVTGYGPSTGRTSQEIVGDGLSDADEVRIGVEVAGGLEVGDDTRLALTTPALTVGAHDVTVANADTFGTLVGGFIAYDPNETQTNVLGVTPPRASTAGGAVISIVGTGFAPDAQVAIAGQRLQVTALSANAVSFVLPAGLPAGPTDITMFTGGRTLNVNNRLTLFDPVIIDSIDPTSGPVSGGTAVTIRGSGFAAGAAVRIADVPLADVVVVSDTEITGTTVAGAHGAQDVVVRTADDRGVLEGGFTFEEAFEIIAIEPREGSMAGNTYVSIIGRGFSSPVGVEFDGVEGIDPVLENGSVIGVRTAPASPGLVDVEVTTGVEQQTRPQAYRFYDPRLITGGAWGGPIQGSVNVAVMNRNRDPIAGMVVQLGYDADLRYTAITDENGLATISSPEIRGAQTVTAGAPEMEFVTFMELNARNLTMISSAYPSVAPPDAPVFPCPVPVAAPLVTGRIFRFKSALDQQTRPGWVPLARITYTQQNVFTPNPAEPVEQRAEVTMEGGQYTIVVMRAGTVAVYATFGEYNPLTTEFIPKRMGIVRNVPVAPETITEDINISLDIELDQTTAVRLDNPPDQQPGPSINAIFPFLNLQSDGVIAFPAVAIFGEGPVVVNNLPRVAESSFYYMGGSFTWDGQGGLRNPYSISFTESGEPLENGVDMGPFLQMPTNVSPKQGELLEDGKISWDTGGVVPDIATLNVVDIGSAGGCCCSDAPPLGNGNGQCEENEPQMCGGLPQQFNRWSVFGEGGLSSYALPRMPLGVNAFDTPRTYAVLGQLAVAPRFDYSEFIYNQFSPFFWQSWAVFQTQIFVKEETD